MSWHSSRAFRSRPEHHGDQQVPLRGHYLGDRESIQMPGGPLNAHQKLPDLVSSKSLVEFTSPQ
jgi:hypothetical protein